ncbi:MAG: hypothetical protein ABW022_07265 [Actinoplanes sp.]
MTGLTLRVVWPIHDDGMYDAAAITAAWFEWPAFTERYQVTIVDTPRMRVVELDERQRNTYRAARAVVCEAPVVRRVAARIRSAA